MSAKIYHAENWSDASPGTEVAQLVGGRCEACGKVFFPRFNTCPSCARRQSMVEVRLSRRGNLYSYTIIHVDTPGFKAPYAVGYVDLPEGPRVFGHLDGWRAGPIPLDSPVEIYAGRIGNDRDGAELISIRFRPLVSDIDRNGSA